MFIFYQQINGNHNYLLWEFYMIRWLIVIEIEIEMEAVNGSVVILIYILIFEALLLNHISDE